MYLLSLDNASHAGTTFRVDGKAKLDRHVFQRDPAFHHRHILLIPDAQWPEIRDDIIFDGQRAVVKVDYIIEAGAAEKSATGPLLEEIANLRAQVDRQVGNIKAITGDLEKTRLELDTARKGATGITGEQLDFLRERDALIDILGQHARDGETPVQVLTRLVTEAGVIVFEPDGTTTVEPLPPADVQGPKVHNVQALGKMTRAKLDSIAGSLDIAAPHEIRPAAKLITAIMLAQSKKLQSTAG